MSSGSELDRLDELADKVEFNSSEYSDSEKSQKKQHIKRETPSSPPSPSESNNNKRKNRGKIKEYDLEEFDPSNPTWKDFEEERQYLENDHKNEFFGLIDRLENTLAEEGDIVDLNTGLIIENRGHLNALNPRIVSKIGRIFELESSDESEDSNGEEDLEDSEGDEFNTLTAPQSFYTVCQQPTSLMDSTIGFFRKQWLL